MSPFDGFTIPQKNYFPMPNIWIDICAQIDNLAELKVVQYVLRHTWGYREYGIPKAITIEEFMSGRRRADGSRIDNGTGLKSDRSVKDGIKAALDHGYLLCEVDDSDKGRIKKSYALKMAPGEVDTTPPEENRGVDTTPQRGRKYLSGRQKLPPEGQNLPPREVGNTPRSEKDTLETHLQKDTEEREGEAKPQSTPTPEKSPHAFSELRSQWITTYGPYGDAKWDNDALRWIAEQGGSFDDIKLLYGAVADKRPEKIKNSWYKLNALKHPPENARKPPGLNPATNLRLLAEAQKQKRMGVSV